MEALEVVQTSDDPQRSVVAGTRCETATGHHCQGIEFTERPGTVAGGWRVQSAAGPSEE
ncbi:MAG: hypothetical protein ACQETI_02780 [Halobacteriota archaeon]